MNYGGIPDMEDFNSVSNKSLMTETKIGTGMNQVRMVIGETDEVTGPGAPERSIKYYTGSLLPKPLRIPGKVQYEPGTLGAKLGPGNIRGPSVDFSSVPKQVVDQGERPNLPQYNPVAEQVEDDKKKVGL